MVKQLLSCAHAAVCNCKSPCLGCSAAQTPDTNALPLLLVSPLLKPDQLIYSFLAETRPGCSQNASAGDAAVLLGIRALLDPSGAVLGSWDAAGLSGQVEPPGEAGRDTAGGCRGTGGGHTCL
jgi:hypothetical protein